jgi:hypothetical protein
MISGIEQGAKFPTVPTLTRIAATTGNELEISYRPAA